MLHFPETCTGNPLAGHPVVSPSWYLVVAIREQVVGALVGGAIGDALGAPFEGAPPNLSRELPLRGEMTDDTELTMATCEAVLETDGVVDLGATAARYAAWFREGRVHGAGSSTTKALRDLAVGAHWALAGARGEFAGGAGAAMRVAPLSFLLDLDDEDDRRVIRDFCHITHHHDEAYAGAIAVVAAVQAAGAGKRGWALLSQVYSAVPDSLVRDRLAEIVKQQPEATSAIAAITGTTGYAASVVPFAVALGAGSVELASVLTEVVRAGGDTDTAGAIVGSILGARLGGGALPRDLVERVDSIVTVRALAEKYATLVMSCL